MISLDTFNYRSKACWNSYLTAVSEEMKTPASQPNSSRDHFFGSPFLTPSTTYVDNRTIVDLSRHSTTVIPSASSHPFETAPERKKREAEEEAKRTAWIGTTVFLLSSFVAGFLFKGLVECREELAHATQHHSLFVRRLTQPIGNAERIENDELATRLSTVLLNRMKIFQLKADKAMKYALGGFALLSGGGMMALGGFSRNYSLGAAGKVLVISGLATYLFSLSWHWNDSQKISFLQKGMDISSVQNLLNASYDDNLNPVYTQDAPPPYTDRRSNGVMHLVSAITETLYPDLSNF